MLFLKLKDRKRELSLEMNAGKSKHRNTWLPLHSRINTTLSLYETRQGELRFSSSMEWMHNLVLPGKSHSSGSKMLEKEQIRTDKGETQFLCCSFDYRTKDILWRTWAFFFSIPIESLIRETLSSRNSTGLFSVRYRRVRAKRTVWDVHQVLTSWEGSVTAANRKAELMSK